MSEGRTNKSIPDNLCNKKQEEDKKKINLSQIDTKSCSVWCGVGSIVIISHCRSKINHYWVRDYQFGARVSARCFSAGLLCLRGSTSVGFFFFPRSCFGRRQLSVVVLPSRPPTQRAYSTGQMFWDCSLSGLCRCEATVSRSQLAHAECCIWQKWK